MPEKLITVKEAAELLGIPRVKIRELVEKNELPAYKIGGKFIRFRKDQVEAIRSVILRDIANERPGRPMPAVPREHSMFTRETTYTQSFPDKLLDFFYFNDFYIIAAVLTVLLLFIIVS